jgi:hypothetical protein
VGRDVIQGAGREPAGPAHHRDFVGRLRTDHQASPGGVLGAEGV